MWRGPTGFSTLGDYSERMGRKVNSRTTPPPRGRLVEKCRYQVMLLAHAKKCLNVDQFTSIANANYGALRRQRQ
jgi:hypothetical protein